MPNAIFRFMTGLFAVRDRLVSRRPVLEEAGVRPGMVILDYGCGPGSYTITAADLVNPSGHVYAVDLHPLAIEKVEARVRKRGLANVTTIRTDRDTGLPDGSVDVALLYDIIQLLSEPGEVLEEVRRVLRPEGVLSLSWHSVAKVERLFEPMNQGMFVLVKRGKLCINYRAVRE
jgi:ubiquinone/menaquinone biosynthesis C-methylase UbiE